MIRSLFNPAIFHLLLFQVSNSLHGYVKLTQKVVEEFLDNLAWKFGSKAAGIREAQRIFRLLENRGNLTNRDFDRAIQQVYNFLFFLIVFPLSFLMLVKKYCVNSCR